LAPKLRKIEVWETTTADSLLQKPLLGKTTFERAKVAKNHSKRPLLKIVTTSYSWEYLNERQQL